MVNRNSSNGRGKSARSYREELVALRDRWHCKQHPFYIALSEGKLDLPVMAQMMAQHYHHVQRVLPSFALSISKCPPAHHEAGLFFLENLVEESGLIGLDKGHEAHDHMELILDFCRAAGMSKADVQNTEIMPAWRARSSYYVQLAHEETTVVYLAVLSCLEGQEYGIHRERSIPGFIKHYGFTRGDPAIKFFTEHPEADAQHSRRQLAIVDKFVTTHEVRMRVKKLSETAVKLRWASFNDLYRYGVLRQTDPLPPGIRAG